MANAQDISPMGARSWALGNASSVLNDAWSTFNNPAGLGGLKTTQVGVYAENRFAVKELNRGALTLAVKTGSGFIGFNASQYGIQGFNRQQFGLSYGRAFGPRFSAGVKLNYMLTQAGAYGRSGNFVAEGGVQFKPSNNLTFGFHFFNPNRVILNNRTGETLPSWARLGLGWNVSKTVLLVTEVMHDMDKRLQFRGGIEYQISSAFFLRAGLSTNPFSNAFGFGWKQKHLQLDMTASWHPVLGFSPRMSLQWAFGDQ